MVRIDKNNIEDIFPMSDLSVGMVSESLKGDKSSVFYDQFVYQINIVKFNKDVFDKCIDLLADKHINLRSTFNLFDYDEPVQIVLKKAELDVEHIELIGLTKEEKELHINEFLVNDRRKAFSFKDGKPFWKIRTFLLSPNLLCLIWINHHSIFDGWSTSLFIKELHELYFRIQETPDYKPAKLKSTYRDYILRQKAAINNPKITDYWKKEFAHFHAYNIPMHKKKDEEYEIFTCNFGSDYIGFVNELAKKFNSSIKDICFIAHTYCLYMISNQTEFVAGIVNHNRPIIEDGDKILGSFANLTPINVKIKKDISWAQYVKNISEKLLEVKQYEEVTLSALQKLIKRDHVTESICKTNFTFLDFFILKDFFVNDTESELNDKEPDTYNFLDYEKTDTYLDFAVGITTGSFVLTIRYYPSVTPTNTILALKNYFSSFLNNLKDNAYQLCSKNKIYTPEEKNDIIQKLNDTDSKESYNTNIIDLFKNQVKKTPNGIALVYKDKHFNYNELDTITDKLANILLTKGISKGMLIGLMLDQSDKLIISILAILKTGCAYVPISYRHPIKRIEHILKDCGLQYIVSTDNIISKLEDALQIGEGNSIIIFSEEEIQKEKAGFTRIQTHNTDIAYLIYTSGSTGYPKGVIMNHKNLVNIFYSIKKIVYDNFDKPLNIGLIAEYIFDASLQQIVPSLLLGHALHPVPTDIKTDGYRLLDYINDKKINVIDGTPHHLQIINKYTSGVQSKFSLENFIIGGDLLTKQICRKTYELFPESKIINVYGPTETCVDSTAYEVVKEEMDMLENIPIGKPLLDEKVFILNEYDEIQPIEVTGELCISGYGLGEGYLNNPDLTNQKFTKNPYNTNELMYRTGDLARWLPDGNIEYIGRVDNQIKIRGNRIELNEIDTLSIKYAGITHARSFIRSSDESEKYIVMYFISENIIESQNIRDYFSEFIPQYMIPSFFIRIDSFPLNSNGKVDESLLPDPLNLFRNSQNSIEEPTNEIEANLKEVWLSVLKLENVSIEDNFLIVGGDSIRSIYLISEINEKFNTSFDIRHIYQYDTIRKFAELISEVVNNRQEEAVSDEDILDEISALKDDFLNEM